MHVFYTKLEFNTPLSVKNRPNMLGQFVDANQLVDWQLVFTAVV